MQAHGTGKSKAQLPFCPPESKSVFFLHNNKIFLGKHIIAYRNARREREHKQNAHSAAALRVGVL
jgi:hypothetical protein